MEKEVKLRSKTGLLAVLVVLLALFLSMTVLWIAHMYYLEYQRPEVPKSEKVYYDSKDSVEL